MGTPCRLNAFVGREWPCPEAQCPFWDPGGAALEGRCAFEQVDLAGRPEVVAELLRIRDELGAGSEAERRSAWRAYRRVLNRSEE